ncbi:hypothetical protein [Planomicrobium sp. YIM 101495]|uniref:hypothetical protein n=1 Tax=Planomicrobium sp. YIM 101495 TaxID=2665160 RepID=UPI0012B70FB1|nr:hypothetical protein [Planomicrobium sp. YIM 101495]MTD29854.1 hypothetical protein [Planomicrobium sp. YIM 101495]
MKRNFKYAIAILLTLALSITISSLVSEGYTEGSTTENVEVATKGKNSEKHWIVLSNEKKIYIDNFSIWALIEEKQNYTVEYNQSKKSKEYQLVTIVPGDYNGRF